MKVEKLTDEQVAALPKWRDEWLKIGLSTEPANRKAAEAAIKTIYERSSKLPPKYIVWLDSPLGGAIGATLLANANRAQVRDQVGDQVRAQVRDQVGDQVGAQVWAQVRAQVRDQVGDQVGMCGYGQHDANWLAFYDFFDSNFQLAEKADGLRELAKHCGWWWPFDNFCILTERPHLLKRDEHNRLHSETAKAIEYPDGWGVYAWHGVRIPGEWIDERHRLTPEIALKWKNIEQRRAACEILGWERILNELKAKSIDKDHDPMIGELVEVNLPDTGKERFLRVTCGTGRKFAIPVTNFGYNTAKECNAATYGWKPGLPIEHFIPAIRT